MGAFASFFFLVFFSGFYSTSGVLDLAKNKYKGHYLVSIYLSNISLYCFHYCILKILSLNSFWEFHHLTKFSKSGIFDVPLDVDLGSLVFLAFAFSKALASLLFCFVCVFLVVMSMMMASIKCSNKCVMKFCIISLDLNLALRIKNYQYLMINKTILFT